MFMKTSSICAIAFALCNAAQAAGQAHAESQSGLFVGDLGNAIWTLVIFILVIVVLGKFAWRPVLEALHKREDFIRTSLEHARLERERAETDRKNYETQLQQAKQDAASLLDEARQNGEHLRKQIEQEARQRGNELIELAKKEIDIARDDAVRQVYDESVELASELAIAALKRQMSPEEHQRLVLDSLRELGQRSKGMNLSLIHI